ncbi:filamin-A, partial [Elysia marginata]
SSKLEETTKMPSGNGLGPRVRDNSDGTICVEYEPKQEGMHEVLMSYDGTGVDGKSRDGWDIGQYFESHEKAWDIGLYFVSQMKGWDIGLYFRCCQERWCKASRKLSVVRDMMELISVNNECPYRFHRLCGLAVRHSLRDREVRGSIPSRVKPRTLKLAVAADPPSFWHYKFIAKSGRPGVRIM